jgi:hypothetical protein
MTNPLLPKVLSEAVIKVENGQTTLYWPRVLTPAEQAALQDWIDSLP